MIKTKHNPSFRPIDIPFTPAEVGAGLAGEDGFVFLDSATDASGAVSILATHPDRVMSGSASDWGKLASELDRRARNSPDSGLPVGAAIGWTGYEGDFCYGFYEDLLVYQHRDNQWLACGNPALPTRLPGECAHSFRLLDFQPTTSQAEFEAIVSRAQEYIAAGDIYQVCLAHEFRSPWSGSPWGFYEFLRQWSPAPYGAYLSLGGTHVLSASPECFLSLSGRRILTRPIKGTRPRGASPEADERSSCELVTSPKEIAELVMITDLERNDLGRVCEFGSVRVTDLLRLEAFEQVFHLVSTVEGHLRPEISHAGAVQACSPGGSISGAPKMRACEIIAELETGPRGIYTGSLGYIGFNGESRLNIAIRTVVIKDNVASFHVGAGIVADSIPENEWQETLDKAAGILTAAAQVS